MNRQYDKQDIAQLLSKFMAGTTSLDEEQVLAQYFRTHEVGEDWKEYQEMFALFDSGEVEVHPQPLHKGGELLSSGNEQIRVPFRWGVVRGGLLAVAASVLLLLVFHYSREVDKEKPVTARVETQSASRPTPAPSRQGGETSGLQEDDTAQPHPSLTGGAGGGSSEVILQANDGKGFGWNRLTIEPIRLTQPTVIRYGLSSDPAFTGKTWLGQWFSATDFEVTRME